MSSIPGSVGYISYPMFIEPTITWLLLGFSGYIWLDTKIVLKKCVTLVCIAHFSQLYQFSQMSALSYSNLLFN